MCEEKALMVFRGGSHSKMGGIWSVGWGSEPTYGNRIVCFYKNLCFFAKLHGFWL